MQNDRTDCGTVGVVRPRADRARPAYRLSRRRSAAVDDEFLRALFSESRPDLALLPEELRPALIRMQYESQLGHYRNSARDAVDWIIEIDHDGRSEPVGRCYLRQGPDEYRLLDLAIRTQWRRHGLATALLRSLCADAARAGLPLRLTVWYANHEAVRLYRRHGFVADTDRRHRDEASEPTGYLPLRWSAGAQR